jgi:hypothetical protein
MHVNTTSLNMIIEEEVYIEKFMDLRYMGWGIMCVGLREPCIDSNMHPRHDILILADNCRVRASPRVRYILTWTSYLLGKIRCCTWMICFS